MATAASHATTRENSKAHLETDLPYADVATVVSPPVVVVVVVVVVLVAEEVAVSWR